jgi:hypothetical protein
MTTRVRLLIAGLFVLVFCAGHELTIRPVRSSATVWLSEGDAECMVSTDVANQQKWLPCADVPRHLRATLHLPSGEYIAIYAPQTAPKESVRFMEKQLTQWGYRVLGVFPTSDYSG